MNSWLSEETIVILLKVDTPPFVFDRIKACLEKRGLYVHTKDLRWKEKKQLGNEDIPLSIRVQLREIAPVAEKLLFRKMEKEDVFRTFTASRLPDFLEKYGSLEKLFPPSEQLLMTQYLLYSTVADSKYFPGCQVKETVLQWLKRRNYLETVFPLHNEEHLKSLSPPRLWNSLPLQPFTCEVLRDYFGDKIALYFVFHAFYLKSIIPLALLGCLTWFLESYFTLIGALFCLCAVIWSVFFLESWKRTNAQICHRWSFIEMEQARDWIEEWKEDIRTDFFGDLGTDPITGERIFVYPFWKKLLRTSVCWLVVLGMLLISIWIMFIFTKGEKYIASLFLNLLSNYWLIDHLNKNNNWVNYIPTICYVWVVHHLEWLYTHIADWLTKYENHKTYTEQENNQVAKLVIFQFFNMNMSLLYLAFFERDFYRLRSSLSSFLIFNVTAMNILETLFHALYNPISRKLSSTKNNRRVDIVATQQYLLPCYSGVFDQYLELMRQFSQIILFSVAFPLGALLSLASGLIDIYWERYKLTHLVRRPFPQRGVFIGAWYFALEAISIVSVMTNLGIVFVTNGEEMAQVFPWWSSTGRLFVAVVLEHVLVALRFFIAIGIDDVPAWVRIAHLKNTHALSRELDQVSSQLAEMSQFNHPSVSS